MSFGEYYKLTGMQSHRHPFYGFGGPGDILDPRLAMQTAEALAAPPASVAKLARPLVEGVTAGLSVYAISRVFDVNRKKAVQIAFVLGGLNIAVGLASDYLYREIGALQKGSL